MKICILTSSYPTHPKNDLAGTFARNFAIELVNQKHNVTVLTQQVNNTENNFDTNIELVRFSWLGEKKQASTLKIYNPKDLLAIFSLIINGTKILKQLLSKNDYDIILALWTVPAGLWAYLATKKNKKPYIIWSLGSDIWTYGRSKYTSWIIKKIIKKSLLTFADGFELCKEIKKISGKNCDFLPTTRVLPKPYNIKYKFLKNKINFLFIGRYHKTKGPDILIKAISLLPKNIKKQSFFNFYGTGEMEDFLKQEIVKLNIKNVKINGSIDSQKVSNLMSQVDYLIIPSRFDSIPVVFSEALQSNLPIIATDTGDTGNLIKKFNIGLVCKKENPKDLSKTITKIIKIDRKKFLKNIKIATKIFNNKESVKTFIKKVNQIRPNN